MVGAHETGNETYILNLVRALLALPWAERAGIDYLLYATHPGRLRARLDPDPPAEIRRVRPESSLLRIPFGLPWRSARDRADLLHVTYVAPPLSTCPHVVTVHDISYEFYPEHFPPRVRWMLKTLVPLTLRRAARVITVSEHARREIANRYRIAPERIAVTYEAADPRYRPVTDREQLERVRSRYGLWGRYVLALGNLQPRKNLARLVSAYVDLRRSGQLQGVQLVLAGKAQWRESELYEDVRGSGFADDILFPGYIEDADLPALYSGALVFVYPSIYEGFGLPPLEAMACGTPVICSNAASLPEVVGDAALTVPPTDTSALAQTLWKVAGDPGLRAELVERGLRRAGRFSWQACAEETLQVYRDALARRPK